MAGRTFLLAEASQQVVVADAMLMLTLVAGTALEVVAVGAFLALGTLHGKRCIIDGACQEGARLAATCSVVP